MPTPLLSREELMERLSLTFRKFGFEGASMAGIAEATGLGKASLYHYFPEGKVQMANAALRWTTGWFEANIFSALKSVHPPRQRIVGMLDRLHRYFESAQLVCLPAILCLTVERELFRDGLECFFTRWTAALSQTLTNSGLARRHRAAAGAGCRRAHFGALTLSPGLRRRPHVPCHGDRAAGPFAGRRRALHLVDHAHAAPPGHAAGTGPPERYGGVILPDIASSGLSDRAAAKASCPVELVRRHFDRSDLGQSRFLHLGKKAAPMAGMAGHPMLGHLEQDGVAVAIDQKRDQTLLLTGAFALAPQAAARSRIIADAPGLQRFRHGVPVHPGQHQNLAGVMLLRDGGDQPVCIEFEGRQRGSGSAHPPVLLYESRPT